jgi:hypothetical protein
MVMLQMIAGRNMAKADLHILTVDPADAAQLNFKTIDDVLSWITAEQEYWRWARERAMPNELGLNNHERRDRLFGSLDIAKSEFQQYEANPSRLSNFNSGKTSLHEYTNSGLVSQSARAKFITSLREQPEGHIVAMSALSAYIGEPYLKSDAGQPFQYRYPARKGRAAIVLFDAGFNPKSMNLVSKSLADFAKQNQDTLSSFSTMAATAVARIDGQLEKQSRDFAADAEGRGKQIAGELDHMDKQKAQCLKELEEAKAFYEAKADFAAPVTYWHAKWGEHQKSAGNWLCGLTVFTVVGVIFLIAMFSCAYTTAQELLTARTSDTASPLIILLSAALAAGVTVVFWVARFVTRMFLSERHMAIDAKMRFTMAKTFLALAKKHNVDDRDRALILAPLFRAGTDGIIQDDGALDGLLAMIARMLEKPRPG